MAALIGKLDTRILIATGNANPIEVGTLTSDLYATGTGVQVNMQRWRRHLALAFLRAAWAILTAKPTRTRDRHRRSTPA